MAGASSGSQIGLLYVGDWSREERITKVSYGVNVHVCLRDTPKKKVIIGIFPNDFFANLFVNNLNMLPTKSLVAWAKSMRRYHAAEPDWKLGQVPPVPARSVRKVFTSMAQVDVQFFPQMNSKKKA